MQWLANANRAAALLASGAVFLMMFVGAADVIGNVMGSPVPGAFELTESLMVACVFLAIAHAQASGQHIRVDLLPRLASPAVRALLDRLGHLLSAAVYGAIAWYAWGEVGSSFVGGEYAAGIVRFALWPARLALALGASLMFAQTFFDFIRGAPLGSDSGRL
jgi:TRAP-type C4-dicarboxylate transport system permease small subunit